MNLPLMGSETDLDTNVFLYARYNDETGIGSYGLCVDMGDSFVQSSRSGHAPNEEEFALMGAIEMFNAIKERDIHDVVVYTEPELAKAMNENANRLINGKSEATKATTPVATEPPADTALPEQKDDSEQLPTKGKRSSRKKQKKDDDTPVTRTNAFQPNAKTQADEEDSSLVEKSIPFQTEAETRKERPKPTRTEHKKSSKTDAQTESLFGRDFQNRTKSGSGGSKKRSSSKKAQTIQSDGEQMRFDESNTDVIKCKV